MEKKGYMTGPLPDLMRALAPEFVEPDPMDAPTLRWGILGPGGIARVFAADVPAASNQEVVAVGSRSKERAEQFAEAFGIDKDRAYGSYEELVADPDVDIVYVATPHIRHREDALLALRQGKPVLVEKPLATNAEEAKEILDEAKKRNLFAMEAMWSRMLPHYVYLRHVLQTGALGTLTQVSADHGQALTHVARLMRPELAGGATLDLGVYPLHLIEMALGIPLAYTATSRLTDTGVDAAVVIAGSHDGALSVATCQLDGRTPTVAELTFEDGSITFGDSFYRPCEVTVTIRDTDPETGEETVTRATWDARVPGGFQYEAAEAARQVAAGNVESPSVPWDSTLQVQEVMDQVLRAAGSKTHSQAN